jgi:hypothetical protein
MNEEGTATVTGREITDDFIIIRGCNTGKSGTFDWWMKFDRKTKKIVDYFPK